MNGPGLGLARVARTAVTGLTRGLGSGIRAGRAWLADAATLVYPQRCPSCGRETGAELVLCPACWRAIPRAGLIVCARCLGDGNEPVHCLRHTGFRAGVAWVYDERAAAVMGAFKYGGRPDLANLLAEVMSQAPRPIARPDLVTEVPLHPARRRERGFDQAALLAASLAVHIGVPWVPGVLERTRATRAQARLDGRARRANLAGALRVVRPEMLDGRKVLLVDDVITTGATLEAGLEALGACGAEAAAAAVAWAQ